MQTLKIGARVRCTEDDAMGRITWANGVSVKIRWDDGEQITWRRDSLATRPIEILADDDKEAAPAPTAPAEEPQADATTDCEDRSVMTSLEGMAVVNPEPAAEPAQQTEKAIAADEDAAVTAEELIDEMTTLTETPTDETTADVVDVQETQADDTPAEAAPAVDADAAAPLAETADEPKPDATPAKKARRKKEAKADAEPREKKLGAVDAAAKVLGETGQPMTCQELIDAMSAKGYWKSPGGQTPAATLNSAFLREIGRKGPSARFQRVERGQFALAQ